MKTSHHQGSDVIWAGAQRFAAGTRQRLRWLFAAIPLVWIAPAVNAAPDRDDFVVVVQSNRGLCLDVKEHSTKRGADLIVYRCHGEDNQLFTLEATDRDREWFTAESVHSGLCVDVEGESRSAGAQLIQWTCKESNNQIFDFRPDSRNSRTGEIRVKHSNLCLDANRDRNRTLVTQERCDGSDSQQWTISRY